MNTTSHAAVGGSLHTILTTPPAINAPVVTTTPCLVCDHPIEHVGDIASRICDTCADAVETSRCPCGAEVAGSGSYCSTRCVRAYGRKSTRDAATYEGVGLGYGGMEDDTDVDVNEDIDEADTEDDTDAPIAPRPSTSTLFAQHLNLVSTKAHEHRHDVDATQLCCVCDGKATGVCKCGRKLCPGCGDDETGLCPHCDEVV